MNWHPIPFTAWSIGRIQAGQKTQTRRLIHTTKAGKDFKSPYGVKGDQLWVREPFWHQSVMVEPHYPGSYSCGEFIPNEPWMERVAPWMFQEQEPGGAYVSDELRTTISKHIRYCARDADPTADGDDRATWEKRPPMFMPRWASRITLVNEGERVEHLNDISADDITAEGVQPDMRDSGGVTPWGTSIEIPDYYGPWRALWDSIYGKKPGGSWADNPRVRVVTFRLVEDKA